MKPILFNTEMVRAILEGRKTVTRRVCKFPMDSAVTPMDFGCAKRPPFEVNDILYVRETWIPKESEENGKLVKGFAYKADFTGYESMFAWRPSIHMPKEAARIFLKVTGVRVERLQDITKEQINKEGFPSRGVLGSLNIIGKTKDGQKIIQKGLDASIYDFLNVWNKTLKKDQRAYYSWNANPYVWVIEFERVEREEVLNNGK